MTKAANSAQFQTDLSLAQITPDFFIMPHAELTHQCFAQLVADGHIVKQQQRNTRHKNFA